MPLIRLESIGNEGIWEIFGYEICVIDNLIDDVQELPQGVPSNLY